jgi:porin
MAAAAVALLAGTVPAAAQDPAPAPAAAPAPPTDIVKRGELFGDWGGSRTKLGAKGTKIQASYTQFFDWVPDGDDDRGYDYGGNFDDKVQSSLSKILW